MEKKDYEPLIRRTLRDFDFVSVLKVMEALDWKWDLDGNLHIPTIGELYQKAESLLISAAKDGNCHSSGGFQAYSDGTSVELNFTIAEAGCSIYELEETNYGED